MSPRSFAVALAAVFLLANLWSNPLASIAVAAVGTVLIAGGAAWALSFRS
jgi:hypothetical protein